MTNARSTKRALISSALALILCFTMMLGTTFAWFTDSVTSSGNVIKTGSLDVQLLMNKDGSSYADISNSTSPIFGEGALAQNDNSATLWEPGKTQVAYLAIKNNGTLDLKYTVSLNVENVAGDLYKAMEYAIVSGAQYGDDTVTPWTSGNPVVVGNQSVSGDVSLAAGATHYFALVIHMNEEAGNTYMNGQVNFDLTVLASQLTSESDSFNNQYDAEAGYVYIEYDNTTMGNLFDTIAGLNSGDTLIIPGGTYNTSGSFQVPAGVTIMGAPGETVVFHQSSSAQDNIFECAGDVVFKNVTFESNRKGYAITDNTKNHDTDGDITVIDCKFIGIAAEKNWGIYKNLNGNLTIINSTFDNYNNTLCGINNGGESTTVITGCTFTNINGEAIGYVTSTLPANFESEVIANNQGLTEENVIGY